MTDTRSALQIRRDVIAREKAQHTPGPWIAVNETLVRGPHGEAICATKWTAYPSDPNFASNARLIAAAPELLAALEDLFALAETDESGRIYGATLDKARAAIAKAKE